MSQSLVTDVRSLVSQVKALQRANDQMRRDIERRPLRSAGGTSQEKILQIIDGNTALASPLYYGILKESSQLTTVPSAYDPNSVGTTPGLFSAITGIGRAFYIVDGVLQPDLVLVCLDTRAGSLILGNLVEEDYCRTFGTTSLLVGAGPASVTTYIPQPM